jgi:hypothetical protein
VVQPLDVTKSRVGGASTVARRLSLISGFFAYLQARGNVGANPGASRPANTTRTQRAGAGGFADPANPEAAEGSASLPIRTGRKPR